MEHIRGRIATINVVEIFQENVVEAGQMSRNIREIIQRWPYKKIKSDEEDVSKVIWRDTKDKIKIQTRWINFYNGRLHNNREIRKL